MTFKQLHEHLLSYPNTRLDYPFGEGVAVYKTAVGDEEKMFALVAEGLEPIRLSLKCDPTLAKLLREKYESVMEGYHLSKKYWNTILLTGQLPDDEIISFILHSYNLVTGAPGAIPEFK